MEMELTESKMRVLNKDVIKYFAMFVMFLNHFSHMFLQRGTLLYEVCEDAGYFTAITMCYFLVEGYEHTRSKKKYGMRLLLFAAISQIPFQMAFQIGMLNMLFTLFVCFLILVANERIPQGILQNTIITLLVMVTVFSDWSIMAAVFTILFMNYKDSRKGLVRSYAIAYVMFVVFNSMNYVFYPEYTKTEAIVHGAISGIPLLVSGFVILNLYNGKRAVTGKNFSKWFFYLFYPGHLLVLWMFYQVIM